MNTDNSLRSIQGPTETTVTEIKAKKAEVTETSLNKTEETAIKSEDSNVSRDTNKASGLLSNLIGRIQTSFCNARVANAGFIKNLKAAFAPHLEQMGFKKASKSDVKSPESDVSKMIENKKNAITTNEKKIKFLEADLKQFDDWMVGYTDEDGENMKGLASQAGFKNQLDPEIKKTKDKLIELKKENSKLETEINELVESQKNTESSEIKELVESEKNNESSEIKELKADPKIINDFAGELEDEIDGKKYTYSPARREAALDISNNVIMDAQNSISSNQIQINQQKEIINQMETNPKKYFKENPSNFPDEYLSKAALYLTKAKYEEEIDKISNQDLKLIAEPLVKNIKEFIGKIEFKNRLAEETIRESQKDQTEINQRFDEGLAEIKNLEAHVNKLKQSI
ncbi:MAG: hypothetical protein H0V82_10890 [Candidatus Protochlamydia sp.]|nr:hypothetical protein [Candidatus Protochlamydia sp.]